MPAQHTQYDLTRAKAGSNLAIATSPKDHETYASFTRLWWYFHDNAEGEKWYNFAYDASVQGMTLGRAEFTDDKKYILISAEGEVIFVQKEDVFERVPESGLAADGSKFFGRMQDIQYIGESLFACGDGLQIYKREFGGTWECLAPDLRQPPSVPRSDYCILPRINGPNETEVYAVGQRGSIYFWNDTSLTKLHCPVRSTLIDIHIDENADVWICGADGTLLRGNHRIGFSVCPGTGRSTGLFQRMTTFENELYIASSAGAPTGLLTYRDGQLSPVNTGLKPDIANPHFVDSHDGVLWAMSLSDILRFDGKVWERIDFPGHPPIR